MSKAKSNKANIKSVLLQIQLQQYLPIFQRNEIDFTTFLTLNEQSLKSIGVKNESHCKILLMYIRKLQQFLLTPSTTTATESHMSSIVENENHSIHESGDEELIKDDSQLTVGNNLTALTPITEEDELCFPITNVASEEESNDLTDVTQSNISNAVDQKSLITAPIIPSTTNSADNQDTNETQSDSMEDNYTPISLTSRGRKHNSTDDELILAMRRQRGAVVRNTNWRLSMPVTSSELPSYFDVVDRQHFANKSEELPSYSCSVQKCGYIFKKNEFASKGVKSRDRSWKQQYIYLWGTLLRVYKSEPIDFNRVNPVHEFNMLNAQIGLASDYLKKRNVIRIRVSTGKQFLFQTQSRDECVAWIEVLQSSVNISSTLDEREMPMFITLPTRRRRVNASNITTSTSLSSMNNINYEGNSGIPLINYSLMPVSSSGLTLQQYNEMARELQQVQITGALPQQQLSW
ncbi:401_t:CDS:2 [Funneliformis geosporum]|uniref:401_t:CDS:1 n=1 Tax=Funneliformis geosporum TaxID=1117311 RepID=A0A9W4T0A9_9GLOM|nr:401_t:CDS:2 [Funneliformis geosporum]